MRIERQLQGTLNTIFTEEIKSRNLENRIFPYTTIEEGRADITLKNSKGKPIFFIELKDPTAIDGRSIFDSNVLLREIERSQKLEIEYFGMCNFTAAALLDTKKIYEKNAIYDGFFTLAEIARLSISYNVTNEIQRKLRNIANFFIDRAIEIIERKSIKFAPIDELFIFKIRKLIETYAFGITEKVWDKYRHDKKFEKEIFAYAEKQQWNKPTTYEEIENITYISLLMLIAKLIFYKTFYDNNTWGKIPPLIISDDIDSSKKLENKLWEYFQDFQDITGDFELLIGIRDDIIFRIPFVSDSIIDLVKEIINAESHYNFSSAKYDVIGRIFEELIREDERHKLGQYFTPPHVIDLINAFAIRTGKEKVFDPSCGSGTFLVRAYERKKKLEKKLHSALLDDIYGNDVSDYPAYLTMLNLAVRNISKYSYPKIIKKDFFAISERTPIDLLNRKGEKERKPLPKFDAVIGNPPYTKQSDIGSLQGLMNKESINNLIKSECGIEPSQQSSIFAYFFYHGSVFLKEGGYLAYIVSNSWMDVMYGFDLQQWLLDNFEIISIIDSKVERIFPSASVNTSIVILRKCSNEAIRNKNIVKFIYLKKKLKEIIDKYKNVNEIRNEIEKKNSSVENNYFKMTCVKQSDLYHENKWSKYLKAPQLFIKILEKGKTKFTTLSKICDIKRGNTTGCNEFFIVEDVTKTIKQIQLSTIINNKNNFTSLKDIINNNLRIIKNGYNELWIIEKEYIKPLLSSPKDILYYYLSNNDIKYNLLVVNSEPKLLRNSHVFEYINEGKRRQINDRPTCASRNYWYNIVKDEYADILWTEMYFDRHIVVRNLKGVIESDKFYGIFLNKDFKKNDVLNAYTCLLNSVFYQIYREFISFSALGDGVTKTPVYEIKNLPIILLDDKYIKLFNSIWVGFENKESKSIFEELNCETENDFDLKNVDINRINLDNAFLKLIGYSDKKERENILIDLYKSTIKIINSRISKAQSLNSVKKQRNKIEFSVYVEQLKQLILDEKLTPKNDVKFLKPIQKLAKKISADTRIQNKILENYWKETFNEHYDEKTIALKDQTNLF